MWVSHTCAITQLYCDDVKAGGQHNTEISVRMCPNKSLFTNIGARTVLAPGCSLCDPCPRVVFPSIGIS